jgi:hypothetical protein
MTGHWFKKYSTPQRVQILGSVTSMAVIRESVARSLFRTSCIQRVPQIRFHIDTNVQSKVLESNFMYTNVQSKVLEATGISRSSLQ